MGAENVRYLQQRTGKKGNHGLGLPLPWRGRQPVERALRLLQACETDVDIAASGPDRAMAQQLLDQHQVGAGIEQVRGKTVTQAVRRVPFGQASLGAGPVEDVAAVSTVTGPVGG